MYNNISDNFGNILNIPYFLQRRTAMKILFFLTVSIFATVTYSAKILGVFMIPSYSHEKPLSNLAKELSLKGHEVTVLTTNPIRNNSLINLTEIDTSHTHKILINNSFEKILSLEVPLLKSLIDLRNTFDALSETVLKTKDVQNLLQSNKSFDVVIVECHDPIMYAFGYRFNAPIIGKM